MLQVNKSKARHHRLRELQIPGPVQWMGLLSERLYVGYPSGFTRYRCCHCPHGDVHVYSERTRTAVSWSLSLCVFYSVHGDLSPVSLLHPDDHTLAFIPQHNLDALCAVEISSKELLLCFSSIGVYVDSQGRRSRQQELMWPAGPTAACESTGAC